MLTDEEVQGNGHAMQEAIDLLNNADKVKRERQDGIGGGIVGQLGLFHKLITAPQGKEYLQAWLIADFEDEEQAFDHVGAFVEAVDIGMSTDENLMYLYSLVSTNKKGRLSRPNQLIMASHHFTTTTNYLPNKDKGDAKRSPLS